MKKISTMLALLLFAVPVFAGCSSEPQGASSNQPPAASTQQPNQSDEKKVLRLSVETDLTTLDSTLAVDSRVFNVIGNTVVGLFTFEGDNQLEKGMVEDYKASPDGLQYTFTLRKDVKWSNGEPVTAHDFAFAWRRLADPKTGAEYASFLETSGIKNGSAILKGEKPVDQLGVKATDDSTLEVTLDFPVPFFISLISHPLFSPINEKFYNEKGSSYGTSIDNLLYSGPYVVSKWQAEYEYVLTKNENYYDKENVDIDEIHFQVVKDPNANLNLFETDQLDRIVLIGEQAGQYVDDPNAVASSIPSVNYLVMNHENKLFKNLNARKAFAYALDKSFIAEEILKNGSKVADYFIPSDFVKGPDGKDFRETTGTYNSYDPQKASEYWTKAKQELGLTTIEVKLTTSDDDTNKKIAEYVQAQLEKRLEGLKVTIEQVTMKIEIEKELSGDYEFAYSGWAVDYADPLTFLTNYVTKNYVNTARYSNPEYDTIINRAQKGDLTAKPEERWKELQRAEKILLDDDVAIIPTVQKGRLALTKPYLKNMKVNAFPPDYYYKNVKIEK